MENQNMAGKEQSGSVTQDQQDAYDVFVAQGIKLAKGVAQNLQGAGSQAIADAMIAIIGRLEKEGQKYDISFDLAILLHGSQEILANLLSFAGMQPTDEQVKEIVSLMVGKYLNGAVQSGKMSTEQVVELSNQAQQNQQAGGQGILGGANGVR